MEYTAESVPAAGLNWGYKAPLLLSRTRFERAAPLNDAKSPPASTLPWPSIARAYRIGVPDSFAKETGLKFGSRLPSALSRARLVVGVPLTIVNEPPTMILPSLCSARE